MLTPAATARFRPARLCTFRHERREYGGAAGKPVICPAARNFRLVCLGLRASPTLHPVNLSPS